MEGEALVHSASEPGVLGLDDSERAVDLLADVGPLSHGAHGLPARAFEHKEHVSGPESAKKLSSTKSAMLQSSLQFRSVAYGGFL